jgi:hypothetical protein
MPEEKQNNSLIKRESTSISRVSRSIEITNRILAATEDPFLIPYRKGAKWGFCDRNRKIIISCIYQDARLFWEGLAAVWINRKWGFIDNTGKEVITCIYESAWNFSKGLAYVEYNGNWGFINKSGTKFWED